MSLAAHGAERDCGHTGNFTNILWSLPGVALAGPQATGAWMKEFGAWYFDLARTWDGRFPHQGTPEMDFDHFGGWDATGGYLLAYAMPLNKILLTGRQPNIAPQKSMPPPRKPAVPVDALIQLLESPKLNTRYGACAALKQLGETSAPAVDALMKQLAEDDIWLRIKATEALASIGAPAAKALPDLLRLLPQVDPKNDPRGMQQRYLCLAIFDRKGQMLKSLAAADQDTLSKAVLAGLLNQDGNARSAVASVYDTLTLQQIKPLFPIIHQAIVSPAPSGEMFAEGVRLEGLRIQAKQRVKEGVGACVKYAMSQNPWASEKRTPEIMAILLTYGTHAKPFIPELEKIAGFFEKDEKNFPANLMAMKANCVRETITAIKASTDSPELIGIQ